MGPMKPKPIIFSGPMVRAILEGRKSMTRRVVKPQPTSRPWWGCVGGKGFGFFAGNDPLRPPYAVGDVLWVRETFRAFDDGDVFYKADFQDRHIPIHADDEPDDWRWQSPMFMPRWAARLWLRVTDVRVERVQEISEADAIAEGCNPYMPGEGIIEPPDHPDTYQYRPDYRQGFSVLWDSINAKRGFSWASNPWVWAISFERTDAPESEKGNG